MTRSVSSRQLYILSKEVSIESTLERGAFDDNTAWWALRGSFIESQMKVKDGSDVSEWGPYADYFQCQAPSRRPTRVPYKPKFGKLM